MALTKLITDLIDGSLGTDWQTTPKTAAFTAVAGEGYFVNTTSAAITVTLPSSPTAGDEINLVDYAGTAATNNITITSSDNINGASDDVLINYERGGVSIVYVDATQGWIAYNAANETTEALVPDVLLTVSYNTPTGQSLTYTTPSTSTGQAGSVYGPQTFTITDGSNVLSGTAIVSGLPNGLTVDSQSYNNTNPGNILTITLGGVFPSANSLNTNLTISGLTSTAPPLTVDYLVVAGGGSGSASHGGGGGAGGLRTSYGNTSGGGSSAETSLSLAAATNYTVTVGAGGSVPSPGGYNGNSGSNSVFSTITSAGGGWGEYYNAGGAGSGGSGGGASYGHSGGSGTVGQGYAGGNGGSSQHGGGGGGASQAGVSSTSTAGGNGGNGLAVSITGTPVAFSGGGGGGVNALDNGNTRGSGGTGGGGSATTGTGQSGTGNTGGGGAGGYYNSTHYAGGSGGSGVVIVRYPSAFTITIGAGLIGTTATVGSDKVTTFTSGTGTISFN